MLIRSRSFCNPGEDLPGDFIDHTGNAPTYYMGPVETALYGGSAVMTFSQSSATLDGLCAASVLVAYTCRELAITGTRERSNNNNDLVVYPDPGNGTFNLRMPEAIGMYKLSVSDVTGRTILAKQLNASDPGATFEIKAKGFYLVSITNGAETITRKIIIE